MIYLDEYEILRRLLRRSPVWFSVPVVKLVGSEKSFGVLSFVFKDDEENFKIYLSNKKEIYRIATNAIQNSKFFIQNLTEK